MISQTSDARFGNVRVNANNAQLDLLNTFELRSLMRRFFGNIAQFSINVE
jgi:hypothetical protein